MNIKRLLRMIKIPALLILPIAFLCGLFGCTQATAPSAEQTTPLNPGLPKLKVVSIDVSADPPPISEIPFENVNKYVKEIYPPDEALYNYIYAAADRMDQTVDISSFDLTYDEKFDTVECLSIEPRYYLYDLQCAVLTEDESHVQFIYYSGNKAAAEQNKRAFSAHLSHLIYNAAPEDGTDLQKLFSVYSYILDHYEYSPDMNDETTTSPYSILNNGYATCEGYAFLMANVLNRLGLTAEFVVNDIHAWNIVKLNGQWYHCDVTFGVGPQEKGYNLLNSVLMDDEARRKGLLENDAPGSMFIIGYVRTNMLHAPACSDTRFSAYNGIESNFAVDADHTTVYFSDGLDISAMNLDCSDKRVLTHHQASQMLAFDGKLFYIDDNDGNLYLLIEGAEPMLIDSGSLPFCYLKRQDGKLLYGVNKNDCKTLKLLFAPAIPSSANRKSDVSLPAGRTFETVITFSEPMDTGADWNKHVFFTDEDGNAYPLRFYWNDDATQLCVRPLDDLYGISRITVSVADAPAAGGAQLETPVVLKINKPEI